MEPSKGIAHLIFQDNAVLDTVTLDLKEAVKAKDEGHPVILDACAREIISAMAPHTPDTFMDDPTWEIMAPALKLNTPVLLRTSYAILQATIPNLPRPVVESRLLALTRIFDPDLDSAVYVELCELDAAYRYHREPNLRLLGNVAQSMDWEDVYLEPADAYESVMTECQAAYDGHTQNTKVHQRWRETSFANLQEFNYILATHPDNEQAGRSAG